MFSREFVLNQFSVLLVLAVVQGFQWIVYALLLFRP